MDVAPETQELFGAADYAVFGAMLALCAAIGLYFALAARPRKDDARREDEGESEATTADDYLMGGRRMRTLPVSMSLIASYVSGITLLGTPTEVYLYGIQYVYICISAVLMGLVLSEMYLPTFHRLGITSTYEYLELRFSKSARIFGSFLFFIGTIIWLPIVMYVAALAFNQVTGVSVHIVSPLVCLVCIFYTCVGGLKAVVWTDVVQTIAMFGSLLLVIIKGTADVGGVGVVWERAQDSGRLEKPNLSLDPLERHTLLVLIVGGLFHWLQSSGVSQMMMQRFLCLPTLGKSKLAVWIFVLGAVFLVVLCSYAGLLIYATYYDCDPLTTKLAKRTDQLLPLLMMRSIGHLPGLPGCFIAGVFSAALSSMSTSLNSMSAVVLEDFYKTFFKTTLTERQTQILMKSVVVITGIICVCLVVVVEKLGSILQMALSLVSITNGPTLGLFSMGLFFPWINTLGVITGGTVGLLFIGWVIIGTQTAIAAGTISFEKMPVSVDGCTYNYSLPITNQTLLQEYSDQTTSDVFGLYRISYLWYTLVGCLVSVLVGLLVSFITGANDPQKVDPRLLSPCVAWIFADDKENEKEQTIHPVMENQTPQDASESTPEKNKCIAA